MNGGKRQSLIGLASISMTIITDCLHQAVMRLGRRIFIQTGAGGGRSIRSEDGLTNMHASSDLGADALAD
jgi:hypothetical protein